MESCHGSRVTLSPSDPFTPRDTATHAHWVESLVVAAELTRDVIAGRDLGAQGEHQHTDGGQPHEHTPSRKGAEGRESRGRLGPQCKKEKSKPAIAMVQSSCAVPGMVESSGLGRWQWLHSVGNTLHAATLCA
jgi:hypothetical protein